MREDEGKRDEARGGDGGARGGEEKKNEIETKQMITKKEKEEKVFNLPYCFWYDSRNN